MAIHVLYKNIPFSTMQIESYGRNERPVARIPLPLRGTYPRRPSSAADILAWNLAKAAARAARAAATRTGHRIYNMRNWFEPRTSSAPQRRRRNSMVINTQKFYNTQTRGYIGLENKFIDTSVNSVMSTSGDMTGGELDPGTVNCLNAITQGDGECQRDGRVVHITSIYIDGLVQIGVLEANATTPGPLHCVLALCMDKQTNKAQLQSEDVWVNPGGTTTSSVLPLRNLSNSTRVSVMWRKKITLGQVMTNYSGTNTLSDQGAPSRRFQVFKRFKVPIKVNYTGTAGAVSNILDKSFHMIGQSNSNKIFCHYNCRIRFKG